MVIPPKQAAMSLGTAEDDHEGDVVLHVAPEHIKENQRPERARKRNLEELQVRLTSLCRTVLLILPPFFLGSLVYYQASR